MQRAMYPSPYMRITQGYDEGTHLESFAIDDAGSDSGIDYLVAPFDCVVKKIYTNDANEVWFESASPVEYADGTVDYMTVMMAHCNDVSFLSVGQIIKQGDRCYYEGTKGYATGNHAHIECGKGKFTGTGWHKLTTGFYGINNGKKPEECFYIDDSIKVLDDYGYHFKKVPTVIPETPPSKETGKEQEESTSANAKLVFTCSKEDYYYIKLYDGDKLYLESSH